MNPASLNASAFRTRINTGAQYNALSLQSWSLGDTRLRLNWGVSGPQTLPIDKFAFDGATPSLESAAGVPLASILSQDATWVPIPP